MVNLNYRLKDEYIEYENDGLRLYNIVLEKEVVLNETATILYKNIDKESKEILKVFIDIYDEVPENLLDYIDNFKNQLLKEFFINE